MFTHNLDDRKLPLDREGKTLQKLTYRSLKIHHLDRPSNLSTVGNSRIVGFRRKMALPNLSCKTINNSCLKSLYT